MGGAAFTLATRPLFMIGNKRSGTSLLVRLLNEHPNLFIAPEADVIWILYQIQTGRRDAFERYQWDGSAGLERTMAVAGDIIESGVRDAPDIRSLYTRVQERLMRHEASQSGRATKRAVSWLGDKKPVQQCDPLIRPFLKMHFHNARYLHIVRHPTAAVASMSKSASRWTQGVPPFWTGSLNEILEHWTTHEEWVLDARHTDSMPVHSLRLEDLAAKPTDTFRSLLDFLELEMSPILESRVKEMVGTSPNEAYRNLRLEFSARDKRVMDLYGYSADVD